MMTAEQYRAIRLSAEQYNRDRDRALASDIECLEILLWEGRAWSLISRYQWRYTTSFHDVWFRASASGVHRLQRRHQWIDYPVEVRRDWEDCFRCLTEGQWTTS